MPLFLATIALTLLGSGALFATNDYLASLASSQTAFLGGSNHLAAEGGGGGSPSPSPRPSGGGGSDSGGANNPRPSPSPSPNSNRGSDPTNNNNGTRTGSGVSPGNQSGSSRGGATYGTSGGGGGGTSPSPSGARDDRGGSYNSGYGTGGSSNSGSTGGGVSPGNQSGSSRGGATYGTSGGGCSGGGGCDSGGQQAQKDKEAAETRAATARQDYARQLSQYSKAQGESRIEQIKDTVVRTLPQGLFGSPNPADKAHITPKSPTPIGGYFSDIPKYQPPTPGTTLGAPKPGNMPDGQYRYEQDKALQKAIEEAKRPAAPTGRGAVPVGIGAKGYTEVTAPGRVNVVPTDDVPKGVPPTREGIRRELEEAGAFGLPSDKDKTPEVPEEGLGGRKEMVEEAYQEALSEYNKEQDAIAQDVEDTVQSLLGNTEKVPSQQTPERVTDVDPFEGQSTPKPQMSDIKKELSGLLPDAAVNTPKPVAAGVAPPQQGVAAKALSDTMLGFGMMAKAIDAELSKFSNAAQETLGFKDPAPTPKATPQKEVYDRIVGDKEVPGTKASTQDLNAGDPNSYNTQKPTVTVARQVPSAVDPKSFNAQKAAELKASQEAFKYGAAGGKGIVAYGNNSPTIAATVAKAEVAKSQNSADPNGFNTTPKPPAQDPSLTAEIVRRQAESDARLAQQPTDRASMDALQKEKAVAVQNKTPNPADPNGYNTTPKPSAQSDYAGYTGTLNAEKPAGLGALPKTETPAVAAYREYMRTREIAEAATDAKKKADAELAAAQSGLLGWFSNTSSEEAAAAAAAATARAAAARDVALKSLEDYYKANPSARPNTTQIAQDATPQTDPRQPQTVVSGGSELGIGGYEGDITKSAPPASAPPTTADVGSPLPNGPRVSNTSPEDDPQFDDRVPVERIPQQLNFVADASKPQKEIRDQVPQSDEPTPFEKLETHLSDQQVAADQSNIEESLDFTREPDNRVTTKAPELPGPVPQAVQKAAVAAVGPVGKIVSAGMSFIGFGPQPEVPTKVSLSPTPNSADPNGYNTSKPPVQKSAEKVTPNVNPGSGADLYSDNARARTVATEQASKPQVSIPNSADPNGYNTSKPQPVTPKTKQQEYADLAEKNKQYDVLREAAKKAAIERNQVAAQLEKEKEEWFNAAEIAKYKAAAEFHAAKTKELEDMARKAKAEVEKEIVAYNAKYPSAPKSSITPLDPKPHANIQTSTKGQTYGPTVIKGELNNKTNPEEVFGKYSYDPIEGTFTVDPDTPQLTGKFAKANETYDLPVNIKDQIPAVKVTFKDGKLASLERIQAPAQEDPPDVEGPPAPPAPGPENPKPSPSDDGKKVVNGWKDWWNNLFGGGGNPPNTRPLNDGSRGGSVNDNVREEPLPPTASTTEERRSRVQELWEKWVWN